MAPARPARVSVVVPALNEAAGIARTLAGVLRQAGPLEVVVVDGGSADGTAAEAARALAGHPAARVLTAPRGRARQLNAGAHAATGDALLFLHADTHLPDGALDAVRDALATADAGCFRLRFDRPSRWLRLWTHPVWMRWHRLAFGDRALFVRRAAFEAAGGFPDQPIFEDLELVRRLRRRGRFVFLDAAVTTSARRFARHGDLAQQARNLALWAAWNLRLPPRWFARFYPYDPSDRG